MTKVKNYLSVLPPSVSILHILGVEIIIVYTFLYAQDSTFLQEPA